MAIRPDDVLRQVTAEDDSLLKRLEAKVDAEIRKDFDGTKAVSIDLLDRGITKLRPAVQERLKAIYRNAGWDASIREHSDQREGPSCTLTLRPRRATSSSDPRDQVYSGPYDR